MMANVNNGTRISYSEVDLYDYLNSVNPQGCSECPYFDGDTYTSSDEYGTCPKTLLDMIEEFEKVSKASVVGNLESDAIFLLSDDSDILYTEIISVIREDCEVCE